MSMTNAAELAVLKLIFQNVDWTGIGDAGGLLPSAADGNFYLALLTADPGEAGDIANTEVDVAGGEYGEYLRVAVARTTGGWAVAGNGIANAGVVTWAAMATGTDVTITHVAVCKAGVVQTDDAILVAELTTPLPVIDTVVPQFGAGDITFLAD